MRENIVPRRFERQREHVRVEDIFSIISANNGGRIILEFNGNSKNNNRPRSIRARVLKTIKSKQQVHLLITPIDDRKKAKILSVGSGTKIKEYREYRGKNLGGDKNTDRV